MGKGKKTTKKQTTSQTTKTQSHKQVVNSSRRLMDTTKIKLNPKLEERIVKQHHEKSRRVPFFKRIWRKVRRRVWNKLLKWRGFK